MLKPGEITLDIAGMEPSKSPEDAPADTWRAEETLGRSPSGSRWANRPVRMGVLLVCLLAAFLALLDLRGSWFGLGDGGSQASRQAFAAGCPGRHAPEVIRVSAQELRALREELLRISPGQAGREYEAGQVTTPQLWTDDQPGHSPLPTSSSRTLPAGYEVRWWALNRDGSEDDVGGDVLEFATPAQAERALTLALSSRCRRDAAARAASYPAGASNLFWVNPDGAPEWDILFVRGRRLFRIVDVPPAWPTGPQQEALRRELSVTTVDVLACAMPEVRCPSRASIRDASLASLRSGSPIGPGAGPAPTMAQATTFAHAVNLRGYLLPGMTAVAREAPTKDRGGWEAFVGCTGELRSTRSVVAVHSPVFTYSGRLRYQLVYSTVTVLASEAQARRFISAIAGARAHSCIERDYRRWLHLAARRGRFHSAHIALAALATPVPATYRGVGPYRATALRLTIDARYTTRRGRRAHLPIYAQGFAFAYGRAVVALSAFTAPRAFPDASQHFLEAALVGRTEAHAG
jgi:hypothetical protein